MDLYNEEGKKLRKKDKQPFYRIGNNKKLIKIPAADDDEKVIKSFIKVCLPLSRNDVAMDAEELDDIIDVMWAEGIERNKLIIDAMDTLKREHESEGDVWKTRAYGKAIKSLYDFKVPIVSGTQVMKIPGIGKGIAAHIDEIIKTGRLKSQDERLESSIKRQSIIEKFMKVWGVGPKHANAWYAKGHTELSDLESEKLTEEQKVGLKYYDDFQKKIRRSDAEFVYRKIVENLKVVDPKLKIEMVGSYRRGADEIGDIDIMIAQSPKLGELKDIISKLIIITPHKVKIITDAPVLGKEKFMGAVIGLGVHHRIDIRLVPLAEWGTSLLHHTGSDAFNRQMRQIASQMGYKLSEKGLYKLSVKDDGDELIPTITEEDVFKELNMDWVPPEKRV